MNFNTQFIEQLSKEFRTRRERNAAYSLRSFSRDLKINPGRLSQYFSGQRSVTQNSALQIMNQLSLSPQERAEWMGVSLLNAKMEIQSEPALLDQKVFELISEPIHFTILSLIETRSFFNNPRWIASRIRSSVPEVLQSLQLLKDLGLIIEKNETLAVVHQAGVRSSDGVQNAALRRAHEKQLSQAIESLDRIPLELRDITSITVAANTAKIPEAKALIKDFRRKLAALLECTDADEVYRIQIQLIPITEIKEEKQYDH